MPIKAWVLTALFLVACGDESSTSTTMDSGAGSGGLDGSVGDRDAATADAADDAGSDLDAASVDAAPLDAASVDAAPLDAASVDAAPLDATPPDAAPADAAIVGIACRAPELTTAPYNVFENVRDDATGEETVAGASRVLTDEDGAPFVLFEVARSGGTSAPSQSIFVSRFLSLGDGRCEWSTPAEVFRFEYDPLATARRGDALQGTLVATYDAESGLAAVATPEIRCVPDSPIIRCEASGFRVDVFPLSPGSPVVRSTGLRFFEDTAVQGIALREGVIHVAHIQTFTNLAAAIAHDVFRYDAIRADNGDSVITQTAPSAFDFVSVQRTSIGRRRGRSPFFVNDSVIFAWLEFGAGDGGTRPNQLVVRLASYDPVTETWFAADARATTFTTVATLPTLAVATHESLRGSFVLASSLPTSDGEEVFTEFVTYDPGMFGGTHSTRGFVRVAVPDVSPPAGDPEELELSAALAGDVLDLDLFAFPSTCPGLGPDSFADGPDLTRYVLTSEGATRLSPYRIFAFGGTRPDETCQITADSSTFADDPTGDTWMAFTLGEGVSDSPIPGLQAGVYVWLEPI